MRFGYTTKKQKKREKKEKKNVLSSAEGYILHATLENIRVLWREKRLIFITIIIITGRGCCIASTCLSRLFNSKCCTGISLDALKTLNVRAR